MKSQSHVEVNAQVNINVPGTKRVLSPYNLVKAHTSHVLLNSVTKMSNATKMLCGKVKQRSILSDDN